jgi:hypothetical protein
MDKANHHERFIDTRSEAVVVIFEDILKTKFPDGIKDEIKKRINHQMDLVYELGFFAGHKE